MKKGLFSALIVFGIALTGCDLSSSDGGNCILKNVPAGVESVTGNATGTVGIPVQLNINYKVENACSEFQGFTQKNTGPFEKEIGVLSQSEGCNCEEIEKDMTTTYEFVPATAGTYLFRFRKQTTPVETYEEITVTVE